jgi:hypothetical protein
MEDEGEEEEEDSPPRALSKWKFVRKTLAQSSRLAADSSQANNNNNNNNNGRRRKSCFAFFPSLALMKRRGRSKWTVLRIVFRFLSRWKRPLGKFFIGQPL